VAAFASGAPRDDIDGVQVLEQGQPKKQSAMLSIFDPCEIPLPDRNLTKKYRHKYRDELRRPTAMVSTARGCPFRCTFCACWKATNGRYLPRQAEQVVDELESIPPDVPHVFFADDNTFHDIARAEQLYRLIKERGIKKAYSAYARSDTVVKCPDLFRRWKEIGLDTLIIGFEATNNRRLKELNKGNVTEKNEKAVEILYDLGIRIRSYLIIDPEFEKADFREVSAYYKRLNLVTPIFSTLTPLPGTKLYEQKKSQINMSYDYFDCIHWVVPTKMDARIFFNQYVKLYMGAYSFRRHVGIMVRKWLHALHRGNRVPNRQFLHLTVLELLVLWVLVLLQGWKVYKHYFAFKGT
jgi:radical SAM superfamily enzyme YgiQ (UPF0313 family)